MSISTFIDVVRAIKRERDYQDGVWGHYPRSIMDWMDLTVEELSQAEHEIDRGNYISGRQGLLQCAAAIIACLEEHGISEPFHPPTLHIEEPTP